MVSKNTVDHRKNFVVSLAGSADVSLPIAASRAGATGLFDLCFVADGEHGNSTILSSAYQETAAAVSCFIRACASLEFGFVLPLHGASFNDVIEAQSKLYGCVKIPYIVLCDCGMGDSNTETLAEKIRFWRSRTVSLGVVITSGEDAVAAARNDIDFVIAKGSEAGGLVGVETSFVLMQSVHAAITLPVFLWGGVNHNTAVAGVVAGVTGYVIDWQLSLLKESPVTGALKRRIERLDGSETQSVVVSSFKYWQALSMAGMKSVETLKSFIKAKCDGDESILLYQHITIAQLRVPLEQRLVSMGQDAVFAGDWSNRYHTVAEALAGLNAYIDFQLSALQENTLAADSPLAQTHGVRYPIVQGPMTRVSDVPEFVDAVEKNGALPFLALALIRGDNLSNMLRKTKSIMVDRSWGVGVLGFNEPVLLREQLAAIADVKPPFAILSGGRVDQAEALEEQGIFTYLHAPSPAILTNYLEDGARKFIFEGRECGGHVGPRTSFVLWESLINTILTSGLSDGELAEIKVLFAGGIHDGLSAAMVSAIALPLTQKKIQVGVLIGTAYIFTHEVVATGAIVESFQKVALASNYTAIAETGAGHAIRCAPTHYYDEFEHEKRRLELQGLNPQAIRRALDESNLGRLRLASKGVKHKQDNSGSLVHTAEIEQLRDGIYMIGQVTGLNHKIESIGSLHKRICDGASEIISAKTIAVSAINDDEISDDIDRNTAKPMDIAIIGIATLLPGGANDRLSYWENIMNSRDAIEEIPADRFNANDWFDPNREKRDKIYGHWGGFVDDVLFDPIKYGIPPTSLPQIEPMQLLALELVEQVLDDAKLLKSNPYRENTGVVLGIGGGAAELGSNYIVRSALPGIVESPSEALLEKFPEWTEDSFAGILLNVVAGRVSNRFDLGGVNFTVDAACASSLASVYLACKELVSGSADVMIAGGCDTTQNPFGYLCFSKTGALSPTGRSRTFDQHADGIVISEGHAAVVLKRLDDAERDGDRIYAVIKSAASGSDGKNMGLTAPSGNGQLRTLRRAYRQAGYSPASVGLFEAHGTGTAVGDRTEVQALTRLLQEQKAAPQSIAIGSVKSMIGHTKCAAGIAGLIKSSLALYHRVLPPTMHVNSPNAEAGLVDGPLYVNSELRPWFRNSGPRRASVSAFGFGGTNFHIAMEEYSQLAKSHKQQFLTNNICSELFVFSAPTMEKLVTKIRRFSVLLASAFGASQQAIDCNKKLTLAEVAYGWHVENENTKHAPLTIAIVSESLPELLTQLDVALQHTTDSRSIKTAEVQGVYISPMRLANNDNVCFLFPGQGSQYLNMMRDLALQFHEVEDCYERADKVLEPCLSTPLSRYIFPKPHFSDEDRLESFEQLKKTDITQPALGASSVAMLHLLQSFGVSPSTVAGHSYGELVALYAAGCLTETELYELSFARGNAIVQMANDESNLDLGGMIATSLDESSLQDILKGLDNCWLSNINSPQQTIVSGTQEGLAEARERLEQAGEASVPIPVSCAFHSPIMAGAQERFSEALSKVKFSSARLPVMSNVTGQCYPERDKAKPSHQIEQYKDLLKAQMTNPVRFQSQIENLYVAGVRLFVEVGPSNVLTKLVKKIIGEQPHAAIALNAEIGNDIKHFQRGLAQMIVQGIEVDCERWYNGRDLTLVNLKQYVVQASMKAADYMWWVNGGYARPVNQARRIKKQKFTLLSVDEMKKLQNSHSPYHSPSSNTKPVNSNTKPVNSNTKPVNRPPTLNRTTTTITPTSTPTLRPTSTRPNMDSRTEVMLRFQQSMLKFVETQQIVMTSYLNGSTSNRSISNSSTKPIISNSFSTFEKTIGPAEMQSPQAESSSINNATDINNITDIKQVTELENASALNNVADVKKATEPVESQLDIKQHLLDLVSQKTGYPQDILDVTANLEADLGIDSIKRVEIIAAFRKSILPGMKKPTQDFMEKMSGVQTLDEILVAVKPFVEPISIDQAEPHESSRAGPEDVCPRCVVRPVKATVTANKVDLNLSRGVYLILHRDDDIAQRMLTEELVEKLLPFEGKGIPISVAQISNQKEAKAVIGDIKKQYGNIAGLIHIIPTNEVASFNVIDIPSVHALVDQEVLGLLYVLQALDSELQANTHGAMACLCITVGAGDFVVNGIDRPFETEKMECRFPWRGAISGLIKCATKEWPQANFAVVDFESEPNAELVLIELALAGKGEIEKGYRNGERYALMAVAEPLDESLGEKTEKGFELNKNDVILITGGARGITAEVAKHFAKVSGAHVLLVGRSTVPKTEKSVTATVDDPKALRKILIDQAKITGAALQPKVIETELKQILVHREINATLNSIRTQGGSAEYLSCDVSDLAAFADLLQSVQSQKNVTAVIHGAGVIDDKYIVDKTPDSFRHVFNTKINPMLVLCEQLDLAKLKVFLLFSSTAGFFGNPGQGDYAAANEVLNRMAAYLQQQFIREEWPGKCAALNWGPWCGAGMVTDVVEQQFRARGIGMVTPFGGCAAAWNEAFSPCYEPSRVILGPGSWGAVTPGSIILKTEQPLLKEHTVYQLTDGSFMVQVLLDERIHPYLADHAIDENPVLPVAVAAELMAETASLAMPEWHVSQLENLRVLKGVVISSGFRELVIRTEHLTQTAARAQWRVSIVDPVEQSRPLYDVVVTLMPKLEKAESISTQIQTIKQYFPKTAAQAYQDWLFHGPAYQSIRSIDGCDQHGIDAKVSTHTAGFRLTGTSQWCINPLLLDTVPQLAILWSRANYDTTPLPSTIELIKCFKPQNDSEPVDLVEIFTRFDSESSAETYRAKAWIVANGKVLTEIDGLEGTGSVELNRVCS